MVSTYYLLIQFLTKNEAGEIHGDQQLARYCFIISAENSKSEDPLSIDKLDQRENKEMGESAEQLILIPLREDNPTRTVQNGSQLYDPE